jgi:hypothetical protein
MSNSATQAAEEYIQSPLDTEELAVPPREAQAHQAEITGISFGRTEQKDSPYLQIDLVSANTGKDESLKIFLPELFVEDINIDPKTLPDEKGNNQFFSYVTNISNGDKNATLQVIRQEALKQGRGATIEGMGKPQNFEEWVTMLQTLLPGTQVIYLKRETENKDTGVKFYNVTGIRKLEDGDNPKALKKYRKMWIG